MGASSRGRQLGWPVVAVVVLLCCATHAVAASREVSGQSAPLAGSAPAWPCRLVIAPDLRPSVELAWARSPTFRAQCERLAAAGILVVLRRAASVQAPRRAESLIGGSADGVTVARVLVPLNAETVELIAHELEHVLEYLDGVSDRHRSGVTLGDGYETERAIKAGLRVAREVRASGQAVR